MITRVGVIALATFREAVRDRVLLVVVLFAVALMLFSRVLGWLSIEDPLKMVQDLSLSALSYLGLFLAMLVGAGSLAREVERRTVYTVLTRTAGRGEFIVGKYLGLVLVFWLALVGSGAVLAVWLMVLGASVGEAYVAAIIGLLGESLVLTSVALFLGALANQTIAAVGTFAFYLVGHSTEALRELTQRGGDGAIGGFGPVFSVLYHVLPNLQNLDFINQTTFDAPVQWGDLGLGFLSAFCWMVVLLAGAVVLFRRRQF